MILIFKMLVTKTPLEGPKIALVPHCAPGVFEIDPKLDAATQRAPAASREDFSPQAILKFHRPSRLDCRVRNKLPVMGSKYFLLAF